MSVADTFSLSLGLADFLRELKDDMMVKKSRGVPGSRDGL
jgi:hypothetical protein